MFVFLRFYFSGLDLFPGILSTMDKMQEIFRFVVEHHQRIFNISYVALILPIFIVTSMFTCDFLSVLLQFSDGKPVIPLLSPIFLQLPNADVVEFQLRKSVSVIEIGYYSTSTFERHFDINH